MTNNDSRQQSNRRQERRVKERRGIDYPFGSPEWIERVQQEHYLWPKQDRRNNERRMHDRRQKSRHFMNGRKASSRNSIKSQDLLTEEEKKLLNELMRQ
ncbi:MAG: hypothetical protein ACU85E_07605 [Gammaproteobacteria bacterium]